MEKKIYSFIHDQQKNAKLLICLLNNIPKPEYLRQTQTPHHQTEA